MLYAYFFHKLCTTMPQEQKQKLEVVNRTQSMVLVKNMLRLSLSSVCYQRGIFPAHYFSSKNYAGVNVHQLESAEKTEKGDIVVLHPEAFLLTQWLEKGVFDSLELRYLKSMTFAVFCKSPTTGEDMLLETYQFHVDYPVDAKAPMGLNGTPMTKDTLKKQAVTFIRSLVEFSGTLDELPEERWLTLKLTYHDDITPSDYEPEYFKSASGPDSTYNIDSMAFHRQPLRVRVGKLETPYHKMELKFAGLESLFEEELSAVVKDINISSKDAVGTNSGDTVSAPLCAKSFARDQTSAGEDREIVTAADTTMIEPYRTPKHLFISQIKTYIMQCGKASVGDCLQHLENLQHEAFIHKKMINPDQSDDDDDDEEEKVDISMVREAFRILTEESFIVKKGTRYAIHRSDKQDIQSSSSKELTEAVPKSTSESSKRKLSYCDSQLSEDSPADTQANKHFALTQEGTTKISVIREPIHQKKEVKGAARGTSGSTSSAVDSSYGAAHACRSRVINDSLESSVGY